MSERLQPLEELQFRGRRPRRLAFGTSGLRGLVSDISDLEAYINTRGFIDYLLQSRRSVRGARVALGGDLRASSGRILEAVARALRDAGMRPEYHGRLPTPALSSYAIDAGIASIMVTGSHIPFDRNGIKFNRPDGEVLKSDEAPILRAVARVRAAEYARDPARSPFDDLGALRDAGAALPAPVEAAAQHYRRRYLQAFPPQALAGLRLGFFAHSAVGRDLLPALLSELGAEVHVFGRSENFVAIDTEALSPQTLAALQEQATALAATAGPLDAVVSTDGDSDRPMLLGVGDGGELRFFSGDLLGLVVAQYLDADAVCVPVSASDAIDRQLEPHGIAVTRTRIGSPWVIAAMAGSAGERRVGWEANGGFLTGTAIDTGSGVLAALPTRDAVLPLVAALHAARRAGRSLPELFAALPPRFTRAGLLDGVDPADSRRLLARFGPGEGLRLLHFGADGVRAVNAAGLPVELDAPSAVRLREAGAALERLFAAAGCGGGLQRLDALDGLRLHFGNGDIAHVRPSGNAPQLRIYAVADSAERAQSLVAAALAEPHGVLRRLLAAAR